MKKAISILLAMALVLSLFTVSTSAANQQWLSVDFENDTVGSAPVSLPVEGTTPSGASQTVELDNGNKVLRFNNLTSTNAVHSKNGASGTVPSELMFMFDFKINNFITGGQIILDFHAGSGSNARRSMVLRPGMVSGSDATFTDNTWNKTNYTHTTGTWYTYMIRWSGIKTASNALDVYRKETNNSASDFEHIGTLKPANSSGWGNITFRFYGSKIDCSLDNIRIWDGNFVETKSFKMDATPITGINQVTNGTLSATIKMTSSEIVTTAAGGVTKEVGKSITPVLVVCDANGRMQDCKFLPDAKLKAGSNEITVSTNTAGYYNNLAGGYAGLYVWKDLISARSLVEPAELN